MIPQQTPVKNHYGNNSATIFDFDFYIENENQLLVTHTNYEGAETILEYGVDYIINIESIGNTEGGSITFPLESSKFSLLGWDTTYNKKEMLSISLNLPIEQPAEYNTSGDLDKKNLEYSLDYLTRICQILKRTLNRTMKVSEGSGDLNLKLPLPEANKTFKWNSDGSALENYDLVGENNSFKSQILSDIADAQYSMINTISFNKLELKNMIDEFKTEINENIDDVNKAATKVNQLESAVQTAVNSATIATNKASEIEVKLSNTNIDLNQLVQNAQINIDKAIENISEKAFTIENFHDDTKQDKLTAITHSNTTNCITEIPQRIKLELNNGTLTLKAGSQVIVPNGFEADGTTPKFDYVTITSDKTYYSTSWTGNNKPIELKPDKSTLMVHNGSHYSGTNAPTGIQYMMWYDTANNLMKYTTNSGSTWESGYSLPFGTISATSGTGATSIDQIFNGMGYIGSTVWVDKGVKGLIPNGRSEDGSLRNIELTTTKLTYNTLSTTGAPRWQFNISDEGDIVGGFATDFRYNPDENYNYKFTEKVRICPILSLYGNKDGISIFQPYTTLNINSLCNGQWVAKSTTLASNVALSATNRVYSLKDYLPNDNSSYEVIFGNTLVGGSGYSNMFISSSLLPEVEIISNTRIGTTSQSQSAFTIVPIDTDRNINIRCGSSTSINGNYYLYAKAYRRIGTNV